MLVHSLAQPRKAHMKVCSEQAIVIIYFGVPSLWTEHDWSFERNLCMYGSWYWNFWPAHQKITAIYIISKLTAHLLNHGIPLDLDINMHRVTILAPNQRFNKVQYLQAIVHCVWPASIIHHMVQKSLESFKAANNTMEIPYIPYSCTTWICFLSIQPSYFAAHHFISWHCYESEMQLIMP